ncbi:MAG TPA: hypothetical protein VFQ61_27175 [Polyangiaceae bacterium]|nr:hypothetical protein [Polyangiaceae bacterium]
MFTELADAWDRLREEDEQLLDAQWSSWTRYALQHSDDPHWYSSIRNLAVYSGVGLSYALWKASTSSATGFIDVLRLGDGIRQGGWGYGRDALRLLVLTGPALRLARLGLTKLASLDTFEANANCAWVAAAAALRMTGIKHFATLGDLARAAEMPVAGLGEVKDLSVVAPFIQRLGGVTRFIGTPSAEAEQTIARTVAANPNSAVLFGLRWDVGGQQVGHAMAAFRVLGRTMMLDRDGSIYQNLAQIEALGGQATGISKAFVSELLIVENATIATAVSRISQGAAIGNALASIRKVTPSASEHRVSASNSYLAKSGDLLPLIESIGLEVRSVPMRSEGSLSSNSRKPRGASLSSMKHKITTSCIDQSNSIFLKEGGRAAIARRWCGNLTVDYKVYVVRPGDFLARIAKIAYGDETKWPVLYRANRTKLGPNPHNPTALVPGMELEVPVSASQRIWVE